MVPHASTLRGSVSYPAERWSATRYPDGWQLYRSGTTTVAGGETTVLNDWSGDKSEETKLTNLSFPDEPDADVRFETVRGWSTENGRQVHAVRETSGTSFELSWEVHRRAE